MALLAKGIVGVVGVTSGIGLVTLGVYKFSPSEELKTISSLLTSNF